MFQGKAHHTGRGYNAVIQDVVASDGKAEIIAGSYIIVPLGDHKNQEFYTEAAAAELADRHAARLNRHGATLETMHKWCPHLTPMT